MGAVIRTQIVKIGNSQGVRIPKLLLEQSGIHAGTDVEIEVQGDHLTIRTAQHLRKGWDELFASMAKYEDDVLLDEINSTEWDQSEWEW